MRVLFLPDYGTSVGGGHVMRCLTLAGALTRRGAECGFAVLPEAAAVIGRFDPAVQIVEPDWAADVAVVDGYDYTAAEEAALAATGLKVCAFDDILRRHDCDLIVDSGLGRTAQNYPGRTRVLAGPDYCPIRPEFTALREASLARRAAGGGGRVLVSMGLTDVGGVTAPLVNSISGILGWDAMDVVLGQGAASLPAVSALAAADPRITVHVDSRDMAGLAAAADFAVGAGGISQWERACLGLPTLLLILAPNQASGALELAVQGAALVLNLRDDAFGTRFVGQFKRLATDQTLRSSISAKSAALCDGLGAQRIADGILGLVG